jgi:hypothetical protein
MGNISDSGPRQKGIDQPGAADAYNTDVLPGPLAAGACGLTGLLCVVIAGWTTANPTIYRAGLAFQAIVPKISHSFLTLPSDELIPFIIFPYFLKYNDSEQIIHTTCQ